MSDRDVIMRLLLAMVLSGLIGFERERHGRAAGLRTHILVCVGATLVMLTAMHLMGFSETDPGRFAAQVVSGIGFLGAGTIIRSRASVRGLTTAASLWAVAGVGLAVGSGFFIGAIASTVIMLVVLLALPIVEYRFIGKGNHVGRDETSDEESS